MRRPNAARVWPRRRRNEPRIRSDSHHWHVNVPLCASGADIDYQALAAGVAALKAYYNEFDKFAANWLRSLIAEGLIADGDVDDRPIQEVKPDDLKGYTQCHFFAGIGGWSYAARLAGWPDERPLWTGSCPCQPYSTAGARRGDDDPRNLWPVFKRLIAECSPTDVAGEQVASKDGRVWLAGVRSDLEKLGYAVGAADLCSAGVSAPNIRQRVYWIGGVPNADGIGHQNQGALFRRSRTEKNRAREADNAFNVSRSYWEQCIKIACGDGKTRRIEPGISPLAYGVPNRVGKLRGYGNAINPILAAEFLGAYMDCR